MSNNPERIEKILNMIRQRQPDLTLVLENVHDPYNISAIYRSADAVGVFEMHLINSKPKVENYFKFKAWNSAKKWIKEKEHSNIKDCYSALRNKGFKIYATHLSENAISLFDIDLTKSVALVFGNENKGISDEAVEKADGNFHIPMAGMMQSLNVSVAIAVSLYEAYRQRKMAGMYDKSRFTEAEENELLDDWLLFHKKMT